MHTSTTSTANLDPWSPEQLAQATQGVWYQDRIPQSNAHLKSIERILTDSRQARQGDAFLALKGERFDAHDFVEQVAAQGASCVIVSRAIPDLSIPQLIVADTRVALGQLGHYRRMQCQQLKVIALTGSSGKTTTKEMLGSIFSRLGSTLVTRGNLNNDLGVPMMLLELRHDHAYAIMELGASHRGEIDYTAGLVRPDVAGILNIGTAHLGEFGGREAILAAKSEIYPHISTQGTAIIPVEDEYYPIIKNTSQAFKQIGFGQGGDVYAKNIEVTAQSSTFGLVTPKGEIAIQLPFAGRHNISNAEAAAAFALALDVSLDDIALGLSQAKNAQGRLNFIQKGHCTLIDDSYNANPHSMRAAADVLCQQAGIRVMVCGDIGELGDDSHTEHWKLGQDLAEKPLDYIVAVGEFAVSLGRGTEAIDHQVKVHCCDTQADALQKLLEIVQQHSNGSLNFLFKGSRYTHMEHLLQALLEKI